MIQYTVLWTQEAEDELTTIWCNYPDRQEITVASDQFDAELKQDAHQKGYLMSKLARSITYSPLNFYFQVDEGDRKVLVIGVQLIGVN